MTQHDAFSDSDYDRMADSDTDRNFDDNALSLPTAPMTSRAGTPIINLQSPGTTSPPDSTSPLIEQLEGKHAVAFDFATTTEDNKTPSILTPSTSDSDGEGRGETSSVLAPTKDNQPAPTTCTACAEHLRIKKTYDEAEAIFLKVTYIMILIMPVGMFLLAGIVHVLHDTGLYDFRKHSAVTNSSNFNSSIVNAAISVPNNADFTASSKVPVDTKVPELTTSESKKAEADPPIAGVRHRDPVAEKAPPGQAVLRREPNTGQLRKAESQAQAKMPTMGSHVDGIANDGRPRPGAVKASECAGPGKLSSDLGNGWVLCAEMLTTDPRLGEDGKGKSGSEGELPAGSLHDTTNRVPSDCVRSNAPRCAMSDIPKWGKEMVTVTLEPDLAQFSLHKTLFAQHSDFFAAQLSACDLPRCANDVLNMVVYSPGVFEMFYWFLYTGKIFVPDAPPNADNGARQHAEYVNLFEAWRLGVALASTSFQDAVMDAFLDHLDKELIAPVGLHKDAYRMSQQSSAMRRLSVDASVHLLRLSQVQLTSFEFNVNWAEFFYDLALATEAVPDKLRVDPLCWKTHDCGCLYHEHDDKKPCYKTMFPSYQESDGAEIVTSPGSSSADSMENGNQKSSARGSRAEMEYSVTDSIRAKVFTCGSASYDKSDSAHKADPPRDSASTHKNTASNGRGLFAASGSSAGNTSSSARGSSASWRFLL